MPHWDDIDQEEQEKGEQDNVVPLVSISDEERKKRAETLKNRSGDALKEKWRQEDRNALDKAAAMVAPPVVVEKRCHVCTSEHRLYIERQLIKGRSYLAIANSVPNGPSRKSISEHFKRHMALDDAAVRAILEEEAGAIGQNYEEGVRGAITMRGMLSVLLQKGYEDAINNVTTVEPRDLIQMAKLMNDLNEGSGTAAVEEARLAISIFKEALQNVLIKGDIIERSLGMRLLEAFAVEAQRIREDQEISGGLDRLMPAIPVAEAEVIDDDEE